MGDFFERMADVFGLQNEPVAFPYHVDRRDKAEKFSCVEGSSVEVEYLLLAQSLIRVAKPQAVLETGTYLGLRAVTPKSGKIYPNMEKI